MPARFPRPPGRVHSSPRPLVILHSCFLVCNMRPMSRDVAAEPCACAAGTLWSISLWCWARGGTVLAGCGTSLRKSGLVRTARICGISRQVRGGLLAPPCPPASRRLNQIPPQEGQRLVHEAQPWSTPSPLPRDKAAAQRGQAPFRRPRRGGTAWVRALLLPSGLPPSPPRACRLWGPASLVRHTCLVSCG